MKRTPCPQKCKVCELSDENIIYAVVRIQGTPIARKELIRKLKNIGVWAPKDQHLDVVKVTVTPISSDAEKQQGFPVLDWK